MMCARIQVSDSTEQLKQPFDYIPEDLNEPSTGPMRYLELAQAKVGEFVSQNQHAFKIGAYLLLISLYHCFLGLALAKNYKKAEPLLILTIIVWVYLLYRKLFIRFLGKRTKRALGPFVEQASRIAGMRYVKTAVYVTLISLILIFVIIDTTDQPQRLIGLGGMACLISIMVLCSHAPSKIDWRPVVVGFSIQFVIGLIVLRWDWGEKRFNEGTELIIDFLDFTDNGTSFVYGFLASPPNICGMDPVFAFKVGLTESNALECISNGAIAGIEIIVAILANLIVFLALLAFVNSTISYSGELIGYSGWSLELFLGYIFYPLAFVMGVTDSEETLLVAGLMGTKTMLNEFIAYRQLGEMILEKKLSERAAMIATYALCGFSNLGSVGIQLGVLGGLAPTRKALFAKIAFRALFAGSISCFMTASLAGILVSNPIACRPNTQTSCFDVEKYKVLLNETSTSAAALFLPSGHSEL
uniref:Sodium/nucleoside cotransporter n=1 Tax=Bursaphelenchus xylophilus TaxID=6326 RepID=A0A1I7SV86_BURXY